MKYFSHINSAREAHSSLKVVILRKSLPAFLGLALVLLIGLLVVPRAAADDSPPGTLIPMGGGYSDVYTGFSQAVVAKAVADASTEGSARPVAQILVLPIPAASHPETISQSERENSLAAADEQRALLETACQQAAPAEMVCNVALAPVLVRADTRDPTVLEYFREDLTAVFILGGDQAIAMQVTAGTPVEAALTAAYERGVIIAGTGAGASIQAAAMLAGYPPEFASASSLHFGAADLWMSGEHRGLPFGIQGATLDQHFFQRGRMGHLLNAISVPGAPRIGIGLDAYTGAQVVNGASIGNVFGLYTVAVLDAETYHAAEGVRYSGPDSVLSLRNVLVHLLAPGGSSYDLVTREHSLGAPPSVVERRFTGLDIPDRAGPLILSGGLGEALEGSQILARFVEHSGGEEANLLVVATGYTTLEAAQGAADQWVQALGAPAQTLVISSQADESFTLPEGITGIVLTGKDQSLLDPQRLAWIKSAWLAGVPLLSDDAAMAALGSFYSTHAPTPSEGVEAELATQQSFLHGRTQTAPGLNLVEANLEPQVLANNRWGRLFSLAYQHPERLALGITQGTALEISPSGAIVLGENAVFSLDLSRAVLDLGSNEAFVIANGLLDVFGPLDVFEPERADMEAMPVQAPTPVRLTPTPDASPSPTPTLTLTPEPPAEVIEVAEAEPVEEQQPENGKKNKVTRTPRPTSTPVPTPPPASPSRSRMMIGVGVMTVIVVILGVWLNRERDHLS